MPDYGFPPRLSPPAIGAGNLLDRQIFYNSESNCAPTTGPGNIASILEGGVTPGQQTFHYDTLNRLVSASTANRPAAASYSETYGIDAFGNMLLNDQIYSSPNYSIDPSTNRLLQNTTDFQYNPNGTLAATPYHSFGYTAEGYLRYIDYYQTGSYLYNGFGQRALAVQNNTTALGICLPGQ